MLKVTHLYQKEHPNLPKSSMPDTKGVEGSFYQILPFEVPTDGAIRGDFGIHFDANVPGSLGCIVLTTQRGWDAFRRDVQLIAAQAV